jgi:hypothetical protein
MTSMSFHVGLVIALTLAVGLLMVGTGLSKKLLGWKSDSQRCSTCGQVRRYDCPCRR